MELILERIAKRKTYTIGHLYIAKEPDGNNPGLDQPLTKGLQICDNPGTYVARLRPRGLQGEGTLSHSRRAICSSHLVES